MAKTYEVLAGTHLQNGRAYTKGKTVESDLPLTKLFPNKFRIVGGSPKVAKKASEPEPEPEK